MAEKIKIAVMGFENGHCYYLYKALQREPDVEIVAAAFAPRARIIYEKRFGREAFDGVENVSVSHTAGTAILTLSRPVDEELLRAAVEEEDFLVRSIE